MSVRRLALVQPPAADDEVRLRVALATRDGRTMSGHFGSAQRFVIFEVSANARRFLETISFEDVSDESGSHTTQGDDRNAAKIAALSDVDVLVVQAIGGPVAARVIRAQIHPVKFSEPEPIEDILRRLSTMLLDSPPPWLRKVMQQKQTRSMDFLDDDDPDT